MVFISSFQAGQFYPKEGLTLPVRSYILECLPAALKGEKFIARPGGVAFTQSQFKPFDKLVYMLEKWAYSKADCLVFGSLTEQENFRKHFGILNSKYRLDLLLDKRVIKTYSPVPELVIPTGVPKQKFTPGNGNKEVVWVGRLKKVKRPELVLEVAKLLPDFTFWVFGDGYLAKGLMGKSPGNVFFMGKDSPAAQYAACDVFLNTSECEGTPRALLEAASFGKPIVTTEIGNFVKGQSEVETAGELAIMIRYAYAYRKEWGRDSWEFVRKFHSVEGNKKGWRFFKRK